MSKVFTDNNFQSEVINNQQLTVVDFWAEWCGPCRAIGPMIEELSKEYEGQVSIGKLNVDENSETSSEFGITSIPCILFFKGGKMIDRIVGAQPKSALKAKIDAHK